MTIAIKVVIAKVYVTGQVTQVVHQTIDTEVVAMN